MVTVQLCMVLLIGTHKWLQYSHVWCYQLEHTNGYITAVYGVTNWNTQMVTLQPYMVLLIRTQMATVQPCMVLLIGT